MSVTQEQVVDYIKNLKLSEVKGLIEILENELGVSASAPVMAVAGGAVAGAPRPPRVLVAAGGGRRRGPRLDLRADPPALCAGERGAHVAVLQGGPPP